MDFTHAYGISQFNPESHDTTINDKTLEDKIVAN